MESKVSRHANHGNEFELSARLLLASERFYMYFTLLLICDATKSYRTVIAPPIVTQHPCIIRSTLNPLDTAIRMSNNPWANSEEEAPPRHEEHIPKPIAPNQQPKMSTCHCHNRYSTLARSVQTVAIETSQRPSCSFQQWELGKIKTLLGLVEAASSIDCRLECLCHSEYAVLTHAIGVLVKGITGLGKTL